MIVFKTVKDLRDAGFYDLFMGELIKNDADIYSEVGEDEDLSGYLGGYFYIVENDEDYLEALKNIENLYSDDSEYGLDFALILDATWRLFGLCTNNAGGNSYFIKSEFFLRSKVTDRFYKYVDKTSYMDEDFFEGYEPNV